MAKPIPLCVRNFTRRGVYSVHHQQSALWKNYGANRIVAGNNPINAIDPDGMDAFTISVTGGGTKVLVGGSVSAGVTINTDAISKGDWGQSVIFSVNERVGLKGGLGASGKLGVSYSPVDAKEGVEMLSLEREITFPVATGVVAGGSQSADEYGNISTTVQVGLGAEVSGGVVNSSTQSISIGTMYDFVVDLFSGGDDD